MSSEFRLPLEFLLSEGILSRVFAKINADMQHYQHLYDYTKASQHRSYIPNESLAFRTRN